MNARCFAIILTLALVVAGGSYAYSRDDYLLQGLKRVRVIMEYLGPESEDAGLTRAEMLPFVRRKFEIAGIKVAPLDSDAPSIYVKIKVAKFENIYGYYIEIQLRESVTPLRLPPATTAITWHGTPVLSYSGPFRLHEIVSEVETRVDEFVNAWLSVNSKK
jgi:hypothetical protein